MTSLTWAPSPRTWFYETSLQWIINPKLASSLLVRCVVFPELRGRVQMDQTQWVHNHSWACFVVLFMSFIVFHELRRRAHGSNAMTPQPNQSWAGFIVVHELRSRDSKACFPVVYTLRRVFHDICAHMALSNGFTINGELNMSSVAAHMVLWNGFTMNHKS
jgi:hypothetical protein